MILNWVLSFSYGLTMEILRAGNTTGIFSQKYYRLCNFNQRRHHVWYYMVTTPGKTVQCPREDSDIDVSMEYVNKCSIFVESCDERMKYHISWDSVLLQKRERDEDKEDLGGSDDPLLEHHITKARIQIIRGNNSVYQLYYSNLFDSTKAKIILNSKGQKYTYINIFLEERVHILKYVSRANDGSWCVIEGRESGDVLTGPQKNLVRQRRKLL